MPITLLPNAELMLSAYLRSRTEITDLVGDRVYTELPRRDDDRVFPLIRVSRIGGGPTGSPLFLDRALVSFDVWGGTKSEAHQIAATVAAVVDGIANYSAHGGYATGSSPGSLRYVRDDSFEKPKPRYVLDVVVYFRPAP